MEEEIHFFHEYYAPMFDEGCSIWINGILPYLEVRKDDSIWFCPPVVLDPVPGTDTNPVRVMEGKPEHNFFCQRCSRGRLDFDGRTLKCSGCGYINSLRKYLVERMKLIEQSIIDNTQKTQRQLKSRRWENGIEVDFN